MEKKNQTRDLFGVCPYVTVQKLLSGKWRILILYSLSIGTCRFNELHKKISGITQSALTSQLRTLEEAGLVERHVFPEIPPHVEYELTELGKEFSKVLSTIDAFGTTYIQWLKENRHENKE